MIHRSTVSGLCLTCTLLLGACASESSSPPAAAALNPQHFPALFLGRWYVIASSPPAMPGYVGSYVEYAQRQDGAAESYYFGHKASFDKPLEKKALGSGVAPACCVVYVDADYQYALLGDAQRQSGWVGARSPQIGEAKYHELLARFDQQGYDTARFERVPQTIEQLGLPGFQTQ